jgi:hypothetical protein
MPNIAPYRKAILASLVAGLTVLWGVLADDLVTPQEWVAVALGFLGTGGSVYGVRNAKVPKDLP